MYETENIQDCAKLYNTLLHKKYIIYLENDITFEFYFKPEYFYHLLGLEKLLDVFEFKNKNKKLIYKSLLNGSIPIQVISTNAYYHKVFNRIRYFEEICKLLNKEKSKILIDFNSDIVKNTNLRNTKFILYSHQSTGYIHLTIGKQQDKFYPETFFYENSKRYISEQILLDIKDIEIIDM